MLLEPLSINLIIGEVTAIDPTSQQALLYAEISYSYAKLILAADSYLNVPNTGQHGYYLNL